MTISVTRVSTDESVKSEQAPQRSGDGASVQETKVQPPFTDYESVHKHPYLVDHFELGDRWRDGFEKEINNIEDYFKSKIELGELKNDTEAVKDKLKGIYKLCNIDKNERATMQIEKLSAYIEFLKKTDHIKLNHAKYG